MPAATSNRSDAALSRLAALHPRLIDLSLDRTLRLLGALSDPQERLPPVIHVAGTNGKGSTVAFIRAIAEAAGLAVHAYTSPHLIRFHERICLSGEPISENELQEVLAECESANAGAPITLFEITTVAAFLAFSRHPADLLLLETGLGGRLDSTNVVPSPSVTVITPVSIDHTSFLGDSLKQIAFEKAGILKAGVPCVVGPQPEEVLETIEERAAVVDAPIRVWSKDWSVATTRNGSGMRYRDATGDFDLPLPSLRGPHQIVNAGTAIASARCWQPGMFDVQDIAAAILQAKWPARFQRISTEALPPALNRDCELWIDGGHNPSAGSALHESLTGLSGNRTTVLICAMQSTKDAAGFLRPLSRTAHRLIAVPLPGSSSGMDPDDLCSIARQVGLEAGTAPSVLAAMTHASRLAARIVVCGSLYLAGEVLRVVEPHQPT